MNHISFWTAFIAGIVSFLSPCILPLVPGYISFISGLSLQELSKETQRTLVMKKAGLSSAIFVLGFSTLFTLMGASASAIGKFLTDYLAVMSKVAGIVIILFGLHTIGILPIKWLYLEKRIFSNKISSGSMGPFVIGLAFAFGWTPCIGPILAGILALAATQETVVQGTLLLFVYSMGLGIPFILTGLGVNLFLQFFNRYKRFIRWGEIAAGVLLLFVGILIFTNKLTLLINYMPEWFFKFSF